MQPLVIPRDQHTISRKNISPNALKVLVRLHKAGYQAYLVGGSVRDILLGKKPKDFDVATSATPEDVKSLFRNCRLIGRRFRLAHVFFGREIIEVATFRGSHENGSDEHGQTRNGMIIRDNVYGSLKEDAWRRDFRINALYYNIADFSIVDFTGGIQDIKKQRIQMIGNPTTRYQEDPVRMLRAIRLANKLDLAIHKKTAAPLQQVSHLLANIPPSRLFDELLKLLLTGHAVKNFKQLRDFKLFQQLFPMTVKCLENDSQGQFNQFIQLALHNTDQRIQQDKTVTPAFILAVLLWQPIQEQITLLRKERLSPMVMMENSINQVLYKQIQYVSIPKRFTHSMRAIWSMQPLFFRRHGKRAKQLMEQPRFRAAYDFLLLRAESGEPVEHLASWWQQFIVSDAEQQQQLIDNLPKRPIKRRKKK